MFEIKLIFPRIFLRILKINNNCFPRILQRKYWPWIYQIKVVQTQ